jgi:hypothetical protein
MAQRAIRFSEATDKQIQEATRKRGFSSLAAFIRHSVEQELLGTREELMNTEERLVASIEQVRHEVIRLARAQQALFALVNSLAKVMLTCMPEPAGEAMEAAVAKAQARHARLLKNAGQSMGVSQSDMQDLVNRGEE